LIYTVKLAALATLAATGAFAQSSVQIDGVMDAGYQAINYKGTKVNGINGNGASTSQINFRGTEDLGGGLKANFRVETDWNTVSNKGNTGFVNGTTTGPTATAGSVYLANANSGGGTFGNGELRVGLSGGFGAIDLGAPNNFSLDANLAGQPFGTAIGSGFRGLTRTDSGTMAASGVRFDNSVRYVSPSFNGVTAGLLYVAKNSKANAGTAATSGTASQAFDFSTALGAYDYSGVQELALKYNNGPINVAFANQVTNAIDIENLVGAAGYTKRTMNTLGANYAFSNGLKAFVHTQDLQNKTAAGVTANKTGYYAVGATYTMGAHTLMAQTGEYKFKETNSTSQATLALLGKKSTISALGYNYALSKRTTVYARYEVIDDKAGAITKVATLDVAGETKRTRTALGLSHAF
jgi:predicted porin